MKQDFKVDVLRSLAYEDDNIIALKNASVGCYILHTSDKVFHKSSNADSMMEETFSSSRRRGCSRIF
jgi:hypothetical protein